jgi:hypothetical protein
MKSLLFLTTFFLTSCFRDIHSARLTENIAESESFVIKTVIAGCCGCESVYYNLTLRKKIKEQLIYEYACHTGLPTKFIFKYDSNANLVSLDTLLAVTDNTYTYAITNLERQVVNKMDSIAKQRPAYSQNGLLLKNITGFRPFKTDEHPHPFPYSRKEKPIYSIKK